MSTEAYKFGGRDAANYEDYLGPLLFEPSAGVFLAELVGLPVRSILETSCGTGRLTRHLRRGFGAEVRLTATDISGDMLGVAKEKLGKEMGDGGRGEAGMDDGGTGGEGTGGEGIEFRVADAQQLPFGEESFDLVVNQYGLMFFPDKQKGVDEAYRVLKAGGHFAFMTWDRTTAIPLVKLIVDDHIAPFFVGEDVQRFHVPFALHDPAVLHDYLTRAGFRDMEVKRVTFPGTAESPMHVVNGLFLLHPMSRAVKEKDPAAVPRVAEALEGAITEKFGKGKFDFELSAWIAVGRK